PPLPFAAGEALSYVGRWNGVEAGSARLQVVAGPRRGALRLLVDAETSGFARALYAASWRLEAVADARTLLPSSVRRESHEGERVRIDDARFEREQGVLVT